MDCRYKNISLVLNWKMTSIYNLLSLHKTHTDKATCDLSSNSEQFLCMHAAQRHVSQHDQVALSARHLRISRPIARAKGGGTALPTCRCLSRMVPKNRYVSGKPCDLAHSRTLTTRCCSGCKTRPCLPIGSGLVTVVLKNPSHSSLP